MKTVMMTAALLMGSTAALAQEAPASDPSTQAQSTAPEMSSAPTDPAAPADAAFTQAQIDGFGKAYVKVRKLSADTSLDDAAKQQQMASAVTDAGIDPQTFNDIATAMQNDPALQEKVQLAVANAQGDPNL